MEIEHNSVNMDSNIEDSLPGSGISANGQWAVLHLTRNSDSVGIGAAPFSCVDRCG